MSAVWLVALLFAAPATATVLGANKPDLMLDYLAPSPPAGVDPQGYRRVRQAMAKKAIADAQDVGLGFFRVAVTGYFPVEVNENPNDLALWQSDPPRFWAALDMMFDDLDAARIRLVPGFVWNITQFPALGHDNVASFMRDPNAASRRLLAQFIGDFITRYKARETILFYEIGGELNLHADLDAQKRGCKADPCIWDNFSTADMTKFAREIVALIKSADPSRGVSSGYALPRASETHLERQPEFSPRGADWTADTAQEFAKSLIALHRPFDVVSIHVYGSDQMRPSGSTAMHFDPIADAAGAARRVGKKLFVGEFGDPRGDAAPVARILDDMIRNQIAYAAIWVWEYYQFSTYSPVAEYNVEPGYTDDIINLLAKIDKRLNKKVSSEMNKTPRVVLTWPLPCAQIDGPVQLAAVASEGAEPVSKVQFLVDGKRVMEVAHPPYKASFDPINWSAGATVIEARAISASGSSATFGSTVKLNHAKDQCNAIGH